MHFIALFRLDRFNQCLMKKQFYVPKIKFLKKRAAAAVFEDDVTNFIASKKNF